MLAWSQIGISNDIDGHSLYPLYACHVLSINKVEMLLSLDLTLVMAPRYFIFPERVETELNILK